MFKKIAFASFVTSAIALFCAAVNAQDFPVLDQIAAKVVQKYQQATCEQLWQERAQKGKKPESPMEQKSLGDVESRSADALGIHQQGSRSYRQQNVRMRHDSMMGLTLTAIPMMTTDKRFWLVLLLAATVLRWCPSAESKPKAAKKKAKTAAAEASPLPEATPSLEPKALDILKAASSKLAAARTMKFTAVHFYENPSRHGSSSRLTTKSEVTLQRPDKLRVIMPGDGPASEFYYDGKKMMAYAPAENLVAVADAPPTIDAALEQAYHSAAIYFPFDDWIVADPYKEMSDGMPLAYYIGQSKVVGGTTTDMVAYIDHGVFVQAWIGAEDKLPRLLHATYLDDPERLRHTLVLSDWQLDAAVPPDTFASAKAASANPMPFAHPHPESPPEAKSSDKAKASKSKQSN